METETITIHSAFSKQALEAIDKIIKQDGRFKSLADYYRYIINEITHYGMTNRDTPKFTLINPGSTTDTEKIMINYPAFDFSGKTKCEFHLTVSKKTSHILGMMDYSMFANLDRISDYALYHILWPVQNSTTITYPMSNIDKGTLASEISFLYFENQVKKARNKLRENK